MKIPEGTVLLGAFLEVGDPSLGLVSFVHSGALFGTVPLESRIFRAATPNDIAEPHQAHVGLWHAFPTLVVLGASVPKAPTVFLVT